MNDLVTPFFIVFLQEHVPQDKEVETFDVTQLETVTLQDIEADSFWCMSKLLDGIQDNYTFAQPGIQSKVNTLKELIQRIDSKWTTASVFGEREFKVTYLTFSIR